MIARSLATTSHLLALCSFVSGHADLSSKRGLALHGDAPSSDNEFLTSEDSPIAWYYTWSPWPSDSIKDDGVVFLPLLHGVDAASDSDLIDILERLPDTSTHLLTFNEPDGEEDTGGSDISPEDAAEAYLEYIVPLRSGESSSRTWNISHPVVTGSGQGLDWLREFNESCYELDSAGCPTDFVAAHYYGDFAGLASWLGTLDEFYNPEGSSGSKIPIWITEMSVPQEGEEANLGMMEESMEYLDELDSVEGYAWFGAFRADDANDWTGDGVSLFDDDGGLTELGATYLGGEDNGFEKGMSGAASVRVSTITAAMMFFVAIF